MIRTIQNLRHLTTEKNKAVLVGDDGRIEISVHDANLFSVFYVPKPTELPSDASKFRSLLVCEDYLAASSEKERWDDINEDSESYTFIHGKVRIYLAKDTGTLSAYRDGVLVHGGRIGDINTVVPSYPLRVQQDINGKVGHGKFNFRIEDDDAFFGLGEKTGLLDKRNRSFKLFNKDALGYDASISDPLYKSVPFFIKSNRREKVVCGLYFPNSRVDEVDFGVESRFYYYISIDTGPFGYFLMTGTTYRDVLTSYTAVSGRPALPPLFSFGYLASGMAYTDYDDAKEKTLEYFDRVEREKIPCEGMYFSSGYAKADNGERYTFVWNRRKFPDPKGFLESLRSRGYRICCNVKPGILLTHPWYSELAAKGTFIKTENGEPYVGYYWGNSASFVDFSQPGGYGWWVEALTRNIIDQGASGVWNDNNEFELEDESVPAQSYKKILPVMMAKASYEALSRAYPGKRPWLISRAGYAGLQRYARTWTGDNVSNFETLRFNIAMGLNLGLSGLPIYGHDIGGFFGSKPDMELLIRWCQSALFQPRFVMHSWKQDGSSTEPWTFPEATGIIAGLIRERYRFLPYIYNTAIQASGTGLPMERALALEYPDDDAISYDCLDRMCGDSILVPSTPDRGQSTTPVRLPVGDDWYNPATSKRVRGGAEFLLEYPLDEPKYFFRCGTVIPTNPRATTVHEPGFPELRFMVIPPSQETRAEVRYTEDDGESVFSSGSHWSWVFEFIPTGPGSNRFIIRLDERMSMPTSFTRNWSFILPPGFAFEDSDGSAIGASYGTSFREPPDVIQLYIRGEYL